jgi:hypothetical protein
MIDTWFFAAVCLGFLSLCTILRVIPGPTRDDRLIAVTTALTIIAGAALALSISWGNLLVMDTFIAFIALSYAGTIAIVLYGQGESV